MKTEVELKYRLFSENDFLKFKRHLQGYIIDKTIVHRQKNHYFDTPEQSLRRNGLSLRLRDQDGHFLLGAKKGSFAHGDGMSDLSVRLEHEDVVDDRLAERMINNEISPLEVFARFVGIGDEALKMLFLDMREACNTAVKLIGSIINIREVMVIEVGGLGITIELDRTLYPGGEESFEAEAEFSSEEEALRAKPILAGLFEEAGVLPRPSRSKSSRLYKAIFGM